MHSRYLTNTGVGRYDTMCPLAHRTLSATHRRQTGLRTLRDKRYSSLYLSVTKGTAWHFTGE